MYTGKESNHVAEKMVEENEERAVEREGACRFCGQIKLIKALDMFTDVKLNELATEQCDCWEAKDYTWKKERKETAYNRVEMLFGAGREPQLSDAKMKMLHDAADYVVDGSASKIVIDVTGTLKMTVNETTKGAVKINRKETIQTVSEI